MNRIHAQAGLTALVAAFLLLTLAPQAAAEEWVLVVDHGTKAKPVAETQQRTALDLIAALKQRGTSVRLLGVRVTEAGAFEVKRLTAVLEAGTRPEATRAWHTLSEESLAWAGAPNPARALEAVLEDATEAEPQIVVFIGPFAPAAKETEATDVDAVLKARTTWIAGAPEGSRLLALEGWSDTAWEELDDLPGLTDGGAIVLAYGQPEVAPQPISLLHQQGPMRATIKLGVTSLRLAQTRTSPTRHPTLELTDPEGTATVEMRTAADAMLAHVTRNAGGAREARLVFGTLKGVGTHFFALTDAPEGADLAWVDVRPEITVAPIGEETARTFDALDSEVQKPHEQRFRVRVTTSARDALQVAIERAGGGTAVPGLRAWLTDQAEASRDIHETTLVVRFTAKPATPLDAEGSIRVRAGAVPDGPTIPFHVSADAGRATLVGTAPEAPLALPQAAERTTTSLTVTPQNANMPPEVELEVVCEPAAYGTRLRLRVALADGSERRVVPGTRFRVPTGPQVNLTVELTERTSWAMLEAGTLTVRGLEKPGVVLDGALALPFRFRRPRLVSTVTEPAYRLVDGAVVPLDPLRLTLDADGGDGQWLLDRLGTSPTVKEHGKESKSDWAVVDEGKGVWRVEAEGAWHGTQPVAFSDAFAGITFDVTWTGGDAPTGILGTVEVPARWGMRGWIFIGLAVLAVALAAGTFLQLRAATIQGTLLYAVEGLQRTVGRIDLSQVGRKPAVLYADKRGRVTIGGGGDPIARIRPTRVGAMIESLWIDGDPGGRLMVDGVVVRAGPHTLRYVAGGQEDIEAAIPLLHVPDLLGPEYDIDGGQMDALPPYVDGGGADA